LLEPRSFDVYKNTIVLIIVMLSHSEINTEVSDVNMKSIESDSYREILGNNKDTNSMLVAIQERARFSCKDRS